MVCDTLVTDPGYQCKHDMFYKAIRGCEILAHEIAHYDLAVARGERDGCMWFLIDAIENKIDRDRKERMRQGLSSGIAREVNQIRGTGRRAAPGILERDEPDEKPALAVKILPEERKTSYCKYLKAGTCKKGKDCDWSHDPKHDKDRRKPSKAHPPQGGSRAAPAPSGDAGDKSSKPKRKL